MIAVLEMLVEAAAGRLLAGVSKVKVLQLSLHG